MNGPNMKAARIAVKKSQNKRLRNGSTNIMTNDPANQAVVAIYKTHAEAEAAMKELQRSDFDLRKLSIVGRDYHTEEYVVGYYTTGDRMRYWGEQGAFWRGVWVLLCGSAFYS